MADEESVRLDRWLWAARVFRSRSLAAEACDGGKVDVDGHAAKPARALRAGDLVEVTLPRGRRKLKVVALGVRRGPASVARELYEDLTPPAPPREPGTPAEPAWEKGGRPTKRDRRRMERLRGW